MHTAFSALQDHRELPTTVALETIQFCDLYRMKLLLYKKHVAPMPVPFPGQTGLFDHGRLYLTESQNPYFIESKTYFFLFEILEVEMCPRVTVARWQFCCGCHYCVHINLHNWSQRFGRKVKSTLVRNVASPGLLAQRLARVGNKTSATPSQRCFRWLYLEREEVLKNYNQFISLLFSILWMNDSNICLKNNIMSK